MAIVTDTQFPAANAQDVAPETRLFLTFRSDDPGEYIMPRATEVRVNGVLAVAPSDGGPVFQRPDWSGRTLTPSNSAGLRLSLEIVPRRQFLYGVKVVVAVTLGLTTNLETVTPLVLPEIVFFIRPAPTTLRALDLKQDPVDRPIALPSVRGLQQALQAGIAKPTTSAFAAVLYRRLIDSPLRAYVRRFRLTPQMRLDVDRVRAEDVGSTAGAIEQLDRVAPLWESSLQELHARGLPPEDLDAIDRTWVSGNALNRVAAAVLVVALAAHTEPTP